MNVELLKRAVFALALVWLAGCAEEEPPRSVADFEHDRSGLDAKLVACFEDRRMNARDPECKNARTAATKIAKRERAQTDKELERQSEQQLASLRRRRAASDAAAVQQREALVDRAEAKVALGQALTADEARALGLDPETSVLSEGAAELPVISAPRQATQADQSEDNAPAQGNATAQAQDNAATSLSDIRKALKEDKPDDD
ncbi:MAG: EexN family lipoprotein [Pseudomonadota bacterium]